MLTPISLAAAFLLAVLAHADRGDDYRKRAERALVDFQTRLVAGKSFFTPPADQRALDLIDQAIKKTDEQRLQLSGDSSLGQLARISAQAHKAMTDFRKSIGETLKDTSIARDLAQWEEGLGLPSLRMAAVAKASKSMASQSIPASELRVEEPVPGDDGTASRPRGGTGPETTDFDPGDGPDVSPDSWGSPANRGPVSGGGSSGASISEEERGRFQRGYGDSLAGAGARGLAAAQANQGRFGAMREADGVADPAAGSARGMAALGPGGGTGLSGGFDPANPRTPEQLARAASGPYRDAAASLNLSVGRGPDGNPVVLGPDGKTPASPQELARLQDRIGGLPTALVRDPDYLNASAGGIALDRFNQLKSNVQDPEKSKDPNLKDIGVSADKRNLDRTKNCQLASGDCNPNAEKDYKKGEEVPARDLNKIWDEINLAWERIAKKEEMRGAQAALGGRGISGSGIRGRLGGLLGRLGASLGEGALGDAPDAGQGLALGEPGGPEAGDSPARAMEASAIGVRGTGRGSGARAARDARRIEEAARKRRSWIAWAIGAGLFLLLWPWLRRRREGRGLG